MEKRNVGSLETDTPTSKYSKYFRIRGSKPKTQLLRPKSEININQNILRRKKSSEMGEVPLVRIQKEEEEKVGDIYISIYRLGH